ncbi:hypothetical protein C8J57DRAFT_1470100 [Mycena rebaudengoi]|nr:hypothetical protein C8J57DRAFT_1470100 [Mycena rebaudengoi]
MPSRALTCWCRGQLWADSDTSTSRNNPVIIGWPFLVVASAFLVTGSGLLIEWACRTHFSPSTTLATELGKYLLKRRAHEWSLCMGGWRILGFKEVIRSWFGIYSAVQKTGDHIKMKENRTQRKSEQKSNGPRWTKKIVTPRKEQNESNPGVPRPAPEFEPGPSAERKRRSGQHTIASIAVWTTPAQNISSPVTHDDKLSSLGCRGVGGHEET